MAKPLCTCNKKYYALNIHTWEKNNYRGVMNMLVLRFPRLLHINSEFMDKPLSEAHLLIKTICIKIALAFLSTPLWGRSTGVVIFLFIRLGIKRQP